MSNHGANVGSHEAQDIKKTTIRFSNNFNDSIKTCYNEVNVILAEAEWVRSGSWIRTPGPSCMGAAAHESVTPQKYFPISHTEVYDQTKSTDLSETRANPTGLCRRPGCRPGSPTKSCRVARVEFGYKQAAWLRNSPQYCPQICIKYSIPDSVPPIHAESYHVATDKDPSK